MVDSERFVSVHRTRTVRGSGKSTSSNNLINWNLNLNCGGDSPICGALCGAKGGGSVYPLCTCFLHQRNWPALSCPHFCEEQRGHHVPQTPWVNVSMKSSLSVLREVYFLLRQDLRDECPSLQWCNPWEQQPLKAGFEALNSCELWHLKWNRGNARVSSHFNPHWPFWLSLLICWGSLSDQTINSYGLKLWIGP